MFLRSGSFYLRTAVLALYKIILTIEPMLFHLSLCSAKRTAICFITALLYQTFYIHSSYIVIDDSRCVLNFTTRAINFYFVLYALLLDSCAWATNNCFAGFTVDQRIWDLSAGNSRKEGRHLLNKLIRGNCHFL